jgi:Mrp family chromosome partitioning ATPase
MAGNCWSRTLSKHAWRNSRTAAVKAAPDAGIIGRFADGVVLVLAANSTTRENAVNCKLTLEEAQVCVAGAVLNKRTYPIPDKLYQYL